MTYSKGDRVKWNWGGGTGEGEIAEVFKERVTRTIKGSEITRDADADTPAYMIEQGDCGRVLKSHTELKKAD